MMPKMVNLHYLIKNSILTIQIFIGMKLARNIYILHMKIKIHHLLILGILMFIQIKQLPLIMLINYQLQELYILVNLWF
jgi:hypothetical protein